MFIVHYVSYVMCHVSCVMCHVSRVTCHLSRVTCHLLHFFFKLSLRKLDKGVKLVGGGSAINGAYPVQFCSYLRYFGDCITPNVCGIGRVAGPEETYCPSIAQDQPIQPNKQTKYFNFAGLGSQRHNLLYRSLTITQCTVLQHSHNNRICTI